jgi:hypothetical protein
MSENNGITKQDLLDMEARLTERLTERIADLVADRLTDRVVGRIGASEERLKEFIARSKHALEMRIIAEFCT